MSKVNIAVDDIDLTRIEERVIELIACHIEQRANDRLAGEAQRIATEAVTRTVNAAAETMTTKILEEGWAEVSPWGETTGKRWSLRGHIVALLNREEGDYHNRGKMIDRAMKKAIDDRLAAELGDVFKEARQKFQSAVDSIVKEKLAETLKSALGLR